MPTFASFHLSCLSLLSSSKLFISYRVPGNTYYALRAQQKAKQTCSPISLVLRDHTEIWSLINKFHKYVIINCEVM